MSANGQSACFDSGLGAFTAAAGATEPTTCPRNSYALLRGATTCTACPANSVSSGGASPCSCNQGYVAGETINSTASTCAPCPAGSYAATINQTSACVPCSSGTFTAAPGATAASFCVLNTFSSGEGATTCLSCPANSQAVQNGKLCACNSGYYGSGGNATSATCVPCPAGAECLAADPNGRRTAGTLRSLAGQWRVPGAASPVFMPCPLGAAACPSSSNGTCAVGYVGVLCGVCQVGFHASGSVCSVCRGSFNAWLLPVMCVVLVLVSALAVWVSRRLDTTKLVNGAKVLVSYLQVMGSSSSSYQIPWPGFMQGILDFYRVALMDVFQVTAVDCYVPMDFFAPFYFVTLSTVALLAGGALVHRVLPQALQRWAPHWEAGRRKYWRNAIVKGICIFMVRRPTGFCFVPLSFLFFFPIHSRSFGLPLFFRPFSIPPLASSRSACGIAPPWAQPAT